MTRLNLKIIAQDPWSSARATVFQAKHGVIETPIFMPVATRAALRGVDMDLTEQMGYQVLLANTYHLLLRPGPDLFRQFGGIHTFMNWPHSVLTDSGGFQIFSLSRQLKMSEEGAKFRSYIDGRQIMLTPELSIEMQNAIGSDIMMVLDHCIDSTSDIETTRRSVSLTHRWAKRSFKARGESDQALFGIVQGACFKELRKESARQITDIPFDGFAIGGLAVGETKPEREDMTEFTVPFLPADKPRYLMGVGMPIDLLEAVKRGVDMFDCILPTALAHQGVCFTWKGKINISRGVYRTNQDPLDTTCSCSTCSRFSRAYLHHLIASQEYVADQLIGIHNLLFYRTLMQRIRESIIAGTFREFYEATAPVLMAGDLENPSSPPKRHGSSGAMTRGDYEVVKHASGFGIIKQRSSGETMHSVVEPMKEARNLYVDQPKILEKAQQQGPPLVIWDVGLGAATNAMTCILALEACYPLAREIHIVSFEQDLDSLHLALKYPGLFAHLRHAAPHELLRSTRWQNEEKTLTWSLRHGNFKETISRAPAPDIIWYDPFSYKVDSELWNAESFTRVLYCCGEKSTCLYTYSASTAVRAAMLVAGWYVAKGAGTGLKLETTVAYSPNRIPQGVAHGLLGTDWLSRWERSDSQQPFGDNRAESLVLIREHPQFRF